MLTRTLRIVRWQRMALCLAAMLGLHHRAGPADLAASAAAW